MGRGPVILALLACLCVSSCAAAAGAKAIPKPQKQQLDPFEVLFATPSSGARGGIISSTSAPSATPAAAAPKPVVKPVLSTPAGAVALMPGLKALPPSASAAEQMDQLFTMLKTPEEVVRGSELVTVPATLQAKLAGLAASAVKGGARVVLPDAVKDELVSVLKAAAAAGAGGGGGSSSGGRASGEAEAGGQNILVPAGTTGLLFSPEIQKMVRSGLAG